MDTLLAHQIRATDGAGPLRPPWMLTHWSGLTPVLNGQEQGVILSEETGRAGQVPRRRFVLIVAKGEATDG